MTVGVAADGERLGVGINERIGMITLLQGGIRRARATGWPLVALWFAMGAATALLEQADRWLKPDTTNPILSVNGIATGLAGVVLASLGSAIGVRLLLEGPARWRVVDRPLLECAALFGLMSLAFAGLGWGYGALARPEAVGNAATLSIVFGGAMLVTGYVTVKLILWPIGRLMGRPEVTAARSWRLMRKATRGYLLAHALLLVPLVGAFGGVFMNLAEPDGATSPLVDAGVTFLTQVFAILSLAIDATVYQLRVRSPATVADVFD